MIGSVLLPQLMFVPRRNLLFHFIFEISVVREMEVRESFNDTLFLVLQCKQLSF